MREDVAATTQLAEAALRAFHRHPVPLSADRALSPASLGRAYLRQMGVTPPLMRADITAAQLAQAMEAFYGPRVEVRIRHCSVPVSLVDFSSQYANVARLLGLFEFLAAEHLRVVDATDEVRQLLEAADLYSLLDPATWQGLVGVGLVRPEGDWLPSRACFSGKGDVPRVGIGPLTSDRALWFSLPDLLAEKVLTGRAPAVESAWRVTGQGRLPLRSVLLAGRVPLDPNESDWWEALVAARALLGDDPATLALKAMGNTTAYGDLVGMDQDGKEARVTVHRSEGGPWRRRVARPEAPHPCSFPPLAAAVTGGGRLLMAILERLLSDEGGCWAAANTDSAAVVSTEAGGLVACPGGPESLVDGTEAVQAMSWEQLDGIRERFTCLGLRRNLTAENFRPEGERRQLHAVGVAGSRVIYFVETSSGRQVVKHSEVALGDLRSPLGPGTTQTFVDETAAWMADRVIDGPGAVPPWFHAAATADLSMGTPGRVATLGEHGSPFGFALGARRARRLGTVLSGERVRVIAPAGSDAATGAWVDVSSGGRPRVVVGNGRGEPGEVRIATYGEEIVSLLFHPESKMLGPGGDVCKAGTRGLLRPRPVAVRAVHLVGKEGNRLEEVATGEVVYPEEVLVDYGDDNWASLVRPVLRDLGTGEVAVRSGMEPARVSEYLTNKRRLPPPETLERFRAVAESFANERLIAAAIGDGGLVTFLASRERLQRRCALPGCAEAARRWPSATCSERHRKALARLAARPTVELPEADDGRAT